MTTGPFDAPIAQALDLGAAAPSAAIVGGPGDLPSVFPVADLAVATFAAAGSALAAATGARRVEVDRRLAQLWFDKTLRPIGWTPPPVWDVVAGDYAAADGWIRLHTNAPRHRDAALSVLGCAPERDAVARVVSTWRKEALEEAVVAAGGCAAAMRGLAEWRAHPQGGAVGAEPLIDWRTLGRTAPRPLGRLGAVRVLDLTRILAGPVATRFLGGFGADVLRIDPPGWDEPGAEPEVTCGKRRAGLDLRKSGDRATFEALLAKADILVHGYRPGALDGLGYGEEARRALNPGLIEVSLCAYGWSGPWASRRGYDSLVQMSAGLADEGMRLTGSERPKPLPVQALDYATGYLMAAAALRALERRARTGEALAARLSLARTAALLASAGSDAALGPALSETPADLAPEIEETDWGPARRLRFPLLVDGVGPVWNPPAGGLRRHPAAWLDRAG